MKSQALEGSQGPSGRTTAVYTGAWLSGASTLTRGVFNITGPFSAVFEVFSGDGYRWPRASFFNTHKGTILYCHNSPHTYFQEGREDGDSIFSRDAREAWSLNI